MTEARKLYVKSFGCQMNVYDAQRMADTLAPEGYVETATADDADFVILNTCNIREKAADKVYSELGRVRRLWISWSGRRAIIACRICLRAPRAASKPSIPNSLLTTNSTISPHRAC